MSLVLTSDQERAAEMVGRFKKSEAPAAVITGYAGTGKTSLIRELDVLYGPTTVLAPTGKAALRVQEATGLPGSTIHRFIYVPKTDEETGRPVFQLRGLEELRSIPQGGLIVVDEASMLDQKLYNDLLTVAGWTASKVIFMGDLFQLPPVAKSDDAKFSALSIKTDYKVNMTEIVRQALESPIIRASMLLRDNKPEHEALALLKPVSAKKLIAYICDLQKRGGVALAHSNARRHDLNGRVREAYGWREDICPGEPLLVLQNNYDLDRYNGEVVSFRRWDQQPGKSLTGVVLDRWSGSAIECAFGSCQIDDDRLCMISPTEITGRTEQAKIGSLSLKISAGTMWRRNFDTEESPTPPYLSANYGYALTGHKSQGSEWPEVLAVIEDTLKVLGSIERKRYVYTVVTRAKQTCSYVYVERT